jgi:hypothetical protein
MAQSIRPLQRRPSDKNVILEDDTDTRQTAKAGKTCLPSLWSASSQIGKVYRT